MQQRKASDSYTLGSNLNWRTRALLCWVAPRGIVAAAVYTLFALRLEDLGHTQAELLVPLTFLIIIGTVFLQGITARPLARLLQVAEPEPRGVLIVGANRVARAMAKALKELVNGWLTAWSSDPRKDVSIDGGISK